MKFKEGVPTKKGFYLIRVGASTLRLVRVRGAQDGEGSNEPGIVGEKVYEFRNVTRDEWVRYDPQVGTSRGSMYSPRIRHAVGFGLEPQEKNTPKAPQVVVELTHEQSQDADLVRRIKASGACWQVDMLQHVREAFSKDYCKSVGPIAWCNETKEPVCKAAKYAWEMHKRLSGIRS